MKKALFLFYLLAIIWQHTAGQEPRRVSGMVTGLNGPLAGVSVSVKGSTRQVATDVAGRYTISAANTDTLLFTNVGYESQLIAVTGRSQIDAILVSSTSSLDEVVVVGYGTQMRRNVTGSVAKVDMEQLKGLPISNPSQAFRGRVAGVQFTDSGRPGQGGTVLVRGPRSLSGGNDPLIVLDGIIFNGGFSFLNPNDIESMEVLKDASSAAIYGSRAANGVILITTKKGASDAPKIQANANFGLSDWGREVRLLSPERYIEKTLEMRLVQGLEVDPNQISDYLMPSEAINYNAGKTINPWKEVSQQGKIASYDVNISGRTNRLGYYFSGGVINEQGVVYNDAAKKLSVRSNIDIKVFDWMTLGLNGSFQQRDLSGIVPSLSAAYYNSPYGSWYREDGRATQFTVPEDNVSSNPMYNALLSPQEEIYSNVFANFYAEINVPYIEGLRYRMNYSPNIASGRNYRYMMQDPDRTDNHTFAEKYNEGRFDWSMEHILYYSKQIGNDHVLDLTLLYGRNQFNVEATSATARQLSSDALGWNNLALGNTLVNSSTARKQEDVSSMFRINYRLKNKYLFNFTIRRDGSSVFAENNKYANFPSAAFGWIISEEKLLNSTPFLDFLKLRLSYGAVGNQAISPYQSLSVSAINQYVYGDGGQTAIGMFTTRMANNNLKWEVTYNANIGLDFELFRNRVSGAVDIYNMDTKNLLVERSIPVATGFNSVWANLGATNNKGVEVSINTINIRKEKFEWSTNFVYAGNRNKIVSLYGSDADGDGKEDDDLSNRWFIGKPVWVAYDYVFDGIYQEGDEDIPTGYQPGFVRLKDLNEDGKIDADDRQVVGQTGTPKHRWGIGNNFKYGQWSASFFVNVMQGWIRSFSRADPNSTYGANYPDRPLNQFDNQWWTPENKSNTSPSLAYRNPLGHGYYFSRDFLRLQDISIAYRFNESFLRSAKLSSLQVHLSGRNLVTLTKWPGTDPENGGEATGFPMPRTVSLGLSLLF